MNYHIHGMDAVGLLRTSSVGDVSKGIALVSSLFNLLGVGCVVEITIAVGVIGGAAVGS